MDQFRVRLNCVDHYQATPTSLDPPLWGHKTKSSQQNGPQVSVIRVFGATETGQKVCAHIHGAFQYLYLDYEGSLDQNHVDAYIQSLRLSIDHALAVSFRRNNYDGRAIYVAHISLVKGVPFFGYHVGYKYFLKVYILNPLHMTRLADLLHQGAIMKRVFQPYESHLQYLLQWMCDFNLYGCSYMDTNKPYFRSPIPEYMDLNSDAHKWHDRNIPDSAILSEDEFPRQSHCSIEVDICVQDIINREEVVGRPLHHDFVERLNHLAPDQKLVQSMAGLWRDETKRRKRRMGITDPGSSPFPPEVLVSMSADPRNTSKGGWIHEQEYRSLVDRLAEDERDKDPSKSVNFENFVRPKPEEQHIQTTLESVEELFLDRILKEMSQSGDSMPHSGARSPDRTQILVDEHAILQLPDSEQHDNNDYDGVFERQNQPGLQQETTSGPNGEIAMTGAMPDTTHSNPAADTSLIRPRKRFLLAQPHSQKRRRMDHANSQKPHDRKTGAGIEPRHGPITGSQVLAELDQKQNEVQYEFPGLPKNTQGSQGSPRLSQSFGYQVVKNANDPDTALRLSQKLNGQIPHDDNDGLSAEKTNVDLGTTLPTSPKLHVDDEETVKAHTSPSWTTGSPPSSAEKLAASYYDFSLSSTNAIVFSEVPPTRQDIADTTEVECAVNVIYQDAYFSDERDVPDRAREYAGQEFKLESDTVPFLPDFDALGTSLACKGAKPPIVPEKIKDDLLHQKRRWRCCLRTWEFELKPPTWQEVYQWETSAESAKISDEDTIQKPMTNIRRKNRPDPELSQIDGPTQKNKHGFKFSQRQKSTSVRHETQYMSTMSLEVHINSRADLAPDPELDEISAIFWCLDSDDDAVADREDGLRFGVLVLDVSGDDDDSLTARIKKQTAVEVAFECDELDLLNHVVDIVREFDPDILSGYEVHNSSWGYLIERARLKYEYNLPDEFSRMKSASHGRFGKDADRWGFTHTSTIRVTGRHMINIWRAMRSELNLLQYTMENVVFHLLHRRIPHYSFADLSMWYSSAKPRDLAKVVDYFLNRVKLDLEILDANELIPRTSEQARLLGVDFFSVFSRGSQFKVESLMFRIAKPESFVLVSPSRKQVGQQNALECLPLVMEPQSAFYPSPLLVLDFQSLYPSVMIAYNYCYSTCLGRITPWRGTNKMGFADFKRSPRLLELVKDKLNIAPNGMMYVRPEMRKSLLAKMLGEILETRVMVKSGMKVDKSDRTLQQLLNNRQLALKLIANVTYGYTSASFSGRMPCSEIADSIVQTGRETLEKTIAFIHSVSSWGAEVVYGDTDSLFVYLKGKTREQAFDIGADIAKRVTDMNPRPVKLKFEKVYHPCVLLAKKRYVGFKYESKDQLEPEFDAKGIETVRRDGTPAEQKIEERALKTLFRTSDLSLVKEYFQDQCRKIMAGKFSVQDFCFAKEVKLGTYAERGPPPPGALIATKRMLRDPRSEPQYGERVPYVVIAGAPGARLFERCVEPERLLYDAQAELDAEYYISKNLIPPLERIFNLVGANVRQWYDEMPKVMRVRSLGAPVVKGKDIVDGRNRKTMESYMATSFCLVCRTKLPPLSSLPPGLEAPLPLCAPCLTETARSLLALRARLKKVDRKKTNIDTVCRSCADMPFGDDVKCDSRDCPVFYSRVKANTKAANSKSVLEPVIAELETRETGRNLQW
ncbi:DNA polymerase zeta catalytic subunit [Sphaceloma murrayae]|uniref:DNA polymerase n=1 Tax=Sphaceloma murrayae TaxID=2082308 RepID=A0A2K1QM76_9PEZI|nr:DNA polymerase zeta catalytic subunit [Sphaceloma murrayae]